MNTLERMGIAQSRRCQKPLTILQADELNAERSRVKAELDCLRGLMPQEKNQTYLRSYGEMYERLEKTAYLSGFVS